MITLVSLILGSGREKISYYCPIVFFAIILVVQNVLVVVCNWG